MSVYDYMWGVTLQSPRALATVQQHTAPDPRPDRYLWEVPLFLNVIDLHQVCLVTPIRTTHDEVSFYIAFNRNPLEPLPFSVSVVWDYRTLAEPPQSAIDQALARLKPVRDALIEAWTNR